VAYAIGEPNDLDINKIVFRPTRQEISGAGRKPKSRHDVPALVVR
jgi:hypothetical protein